jgi:hypothetical protein
MTRMRRVGQGLTACEPEALETNLRTRRAATRFWLLVGVGRGRLPVAQAWAPHWKNLNVESTPHPD